MSVSNDGIGPQIEFGEPGWPSAGATTPIKTRSLRGFKFLKFFSKKLLKNITKTKSRCRHEQKTFPGQDKRPSRSSIRSLSRRWSYLEHHHRGWSQIGGQIARFLHRQNEGKRAANGAPNASTKG